MHGMENQNERKTTVRIRAGTRKVGWEQYILDLDVIRLPVGAQVYVL